MHSQLPILHTIFWIKSERKWKGKRATSAFLEQATHYTSIHTYKKVASEKFQFELKMDYFPIASKKASIEAMYFGKAIVVGNPAFVILINQDCVSFSELGEAES